MISFLFRKQWTVLFDDDLKQTMRINSFLSRKQYKNLFKDNVLKKAMAIERRKVSFKDGLFETGGAFAHTSF